MDTRVQNSLLRWRLPALAPLLLALFLLPACGEEDRSALPPATAISYEPVNAVSEPELVTLSDTEAGFTWVTDSRSDTRVFLEREGTWEPLDLSRSPTRYHYALVEGLRPATAYRYRLVSGDKTAPETDRSPGRFTTLATPPGEFLFSFATINDTHVGEETAGLLCLGGTCFTEGFQSPWPEHPHWEFTNRGVVAAINRKRPDLVIHKGDVSSEYREEEFLEARRIFDSLEMPYHVVRGNHDRRGRPGEREEDFFRKVFGLDRTYRYFLYRDHLFILLDSVNPETGLPGITEEQFDWLAKDVLPNHPRARVLVFLHHAVTKKAEVFALSEGDRRRLIALLAEHGGVVGVFSGHSHRAFVSHAPRTGDVPFVETPSTKEYPGGFCLYRVYSGGYLQTFYRTDCDDYCLPWFELTKGEYFGFAPAILFGDLKDRNFLYAYP